MSMHPICPNSLEHCIGHTGTSINVFSFLSPTFAKASRCVGTLNLIGPSVCLSVPLSVRPSVTKTLTLHISSEVLMIEHWYLACMILVTSPFHWHHAVTLTFDLLQGQSCCRAGYHNSPNLLVSSYFLPVPQSLTKSIQMKSFWLIVFT